MSFTELLVVIGRAWPYLVMVGLIFILFGVGLLVDRAKRADPSRVSALPATYTIAVGVAIATLYPLMAFASWALELGGQAT